MFKTEKSVLRLMSKYSFLSSSKFLDLVIKHLLIPVCNHLWSGSNGTHKRCQCEHRVQQKDTILHKHCRAALYISGSPSQKIMRMFIIAKYGGIYVTASSSSSTNITALDSVLPRVLQTQHFKTGSLFHLQAYGRNGSYSVVPIWKSLVKADKNSPFLKTQCLK